MGDFASRAQTALEGIWTDRPADVDRMVERNLDTGKGFSVWAYAWGDLNNLGDFLYGCWQTVRDGEGDLETLKMLIARQCRDYAGAFSQMMHMTDTEAMLLDAADAFEAEESHEDLARDIRALQRYIVQLALLVLSCKR